MEKQQTLIPCRISGIFVIKLLEDLRLVSNKTQKTDLCSAGNSPPLYSDLRT
jgi:hypothetical protein